MAPIGNIIARIDVDQTSVQGPRDKISGTITLTFNANKSARAIGIVTSSTSSTEQELFGPLRLHIVLHGQTRLKVQENRTSHAYILFFETRRILRKAVLVFDGPFRAQPNKPFSFPFETSFPERTDLYRGFSTIVPPTFYTRFSATAVRQAGKHQGAAWVDYALQVQVDMPGIEIDVTRPEELAIRYEQSPEPSYLRLAAREFDQRLTVQSYGLLNEDARPVSLLDKTKAALKSVPKPTFVFDVHCSGVPSTLRIGQPMNFEVRIRTDLAATTATFIPEIGLGSSEVELLSRTQLFATNQKGVDSTKIDHTAVISTLWIARKLPKGLFTKADDYTKTITTTVVPQDITTGFRIAKLERSYSIRVVLRFVVAGQWVTMKKELPILILPPSLSTPGAVASAADAVAGPSTAAPGSHTRPRFSLSDGDEDLPAYEEQFKPAYAEASSSSNAVA